MIYRDQNTQLYVLEYNGEHVGYYRYVTAAEDKLRALERTMARSARPTHKLGTH
jgi:hypothetical protein